MDFRQRNKKTWDIHWLKFATWDASLRVKEPSQVTLEITPEPDHVVLSITDRRSTRNFDLTAEKLAVVCNYELQHAQSILKKRQFECLALIVGEAGGSWKTILLLFPMKTGALDSVKRTIMDCVMGNEYACEAELADSDGRYELHISSYFVALVPVLQHCLEVKQLCAILTSARDSIHSKQQVSLIEYGGLYSLSLEMGNSTTKTTHQFSILRGCKTSIERKLCMMRHSTVRENGNKDSMKSCSSYGSCRSLEEIADKPFAEKQAFPFTRHDMLHVSDDSSKVMRHPPVRPHPVPEDRGNVSSQHSSSSSGSFNSFNSGAEEPVISPPALVAPTYINASSIEPYLPVCEGPTKSSEPMIRGLSDRARRPCPAPRSPVMPRSISTPSEHEKRCGNPPSINEEPFWVVQRKHSGRKGLLMRQDARDVYSSTIQDLINRTSDIELGSNIEQQYENHRAVFEKKSLRQHEPLSARVSKVIEVFKQSVYTPEPPSSDKLSIESTISDVLSRNLMFDTPDPFRSMSREEIAIFEYGLVLLPGDIKDDEGGWEAFTDHIMTLDSDDKAIIERYAYSYGRSIMGLVLQHWRKLSTLAPEKCILQPSREAIYDTLLKMNKLNLLERLNRATTHINAQTL